MGARPGKAIRCKPFSAQVGRILDKLAQNNVKPEHCMMRTYQQYTAALFLIPATLWAQSTLPPCHGSDPKRWHQCNGIYALQAGRYVGDFQNGKLHGTGTFHYKDGAKCIGDWREDKRDGTGIYALKRVAISMSASGRRANPMAAERRHLLIERLLWVSIKRANATAKAFCMQQTDQYKGQGCG